MVATSYEGKLRELGLTTLQRRRERGDMIQTWKYLHGQNPGGMDLFRMASEQHSRLSRHTSKSWNVCSPTAKLEVRKNFFTPRSTVKWNSLPHKVQGVEDLNTFKNKYDELMLQTNSSL